MNDLEIVKTAIDKYGRTAQEDKAVEEMAELIQAINKNRLHRSAETLTNICEEIADVSIMLRQLMIIHNISADDINAVIGMKLARLEMKMEAE